MDLDDELAPLETVQRAVQQRYNGSPSRTAALHQMHSRSSSHDSYFESRYSEVLLY